MGFAGEALAGVGDAQRAVDKDFQRGGGAERGGLEALDFLDRKLAGEDGARQWHDGFDERQPLGRGEGHLGGGVDFHVGRHRLGQPGEAEVLNDDGVHAGGGDHAQLGFRGRQLTGEHQRVHRQIPAQAVAVQVFHEFGQIRIDEIVSAQPRVEFGQAEVDRVGTGGHCRPRAIPVARRGQQFGECIAIGMGHAPTKAEPAAKTQRHFSPTENRTNQMILHNLSVTLYDRRPKMALAKGGGGADPAE